MSPSPVNFASDNSTGAAPEVLAALIAANDHRTMPYGNDHHTRAAEAALAEVFECDLTAFPVATGTGANALALASVTPSHGTVFCHADAHIETSECGAPEFFTDGAKLTLVPGASGRIDPVALEHGLAAATGDSVHHVLPAAVSITQLTEAGTRYSVDEIRAIADIAHGHGLPLHMDGARFANAVAASGLSPAEMTWRAGVDILSFGATKNGALSAEAVIFFNRAHVGAFEFKRKRGGHLFSKMRFLSAQLSAYVADGNWLRYAGQANAAAARLAAGLANQPGVRIAEAVDGNILFLHLAPAVLQELRDDDIHFYVRGAGQDGWSHARVVTPFDTTVEETDRFLGAVARGGRT
ncbi:MAG: beta-eliminating lyase-related protein [Pseudomonadota bacterium]|nr:beta-eliminating lyase-related protein [Pseudomonadota bacterium]